MRFLLGTPQAPALPSANNCARPADADDYGRHCQVRARTDPGGIERAKRKGTKFGRPSALDDGERPKIAERYAAGETMEQLAEGYECGVATIWRTPRPFVVSASV
jgi:hypothetical protein